MITEEELKEAERRLVDYAIEMNSGKAHPGEYRIDITEAKRVVSRSGTTCEYRSEYGKQVLYIGNVPRN